MNENIVIELCVYVRFNKKIGNNTLDTDLEKSSKHFRPNLSQHYNPWSLRVL